MRLNRLTLWCVSFGFTALLCLGNLHATDDGKMEKMQEKDKPADKKSDSSKAAPKDKEAAKDAAKPQDKEKEPAKSPGDEPVKIGQSGQNDADTIAFINAEIEKGLKENKIPASGSASDYEWIRRAFLDIIGRVPTAVGSGADLKNLKSLSPSEQLSKAIESKGELPYILSVAANSRKSFTIRYLLNHPDYARHWSNLWTNWLLTRTSPPGIDRENFTRWLADGFGMHRRYDEMVKDLLTATGKCDDKISKNAAAANFILTHVGERVPGEYMARDGQFEMIPATSRITRVFLGVQTHCTQCHDHPFIDERKQSQFWGINVFLRQVERTPPVINVRNNRMEALQHYSLKDNNNSNPGGGLFYERRNGLLLRAGPIWVDGVKKQFPSNASRRQELSNLLIADDLFAKAIVNRMWAQFFGRGFTNPVDDFGEHNPISHPELLNRLASDFVTSGYKLDKLITWFAMSKPYQFSSMADKSGVNAKPDSDAYFARMQLKAMTPEQLVHSILAATGAEYTKKDAESLRKMEEDWLRDFSVNFGDDEGNEATFNGTVVQALMLMNGNRLNEAIRTSPLIKYAMRANTSVEKAVDMIALACVGRPGTKAEYQFAREAANNYAANKQKPEAVWQDLMWGYLNSNEFILNH